ncbi:MAG: DUF805 domain-containing protein [Halopseudomonas aestusnigri]
MLGMLTITLAIFLLPTVVYVTSNEKKLGRLPYFIRTLFLGFILWALFLMNFAQTALSDDLTNILNDPMNEEWLAGSWTLLIGITVILCIQVCWMVHRLNHIGWSKWFVFLMLIPIVHGLLVIVPGKRKNEDYSELLSEI